MDDDHVVTVLSSDQTGQKDQGEVSPLQAAHAEKLGSTRPAETTHRGAAFALLGEVVRFESAGPDLDVMTARGPLSGESGRLHLGSSDQRAELARDDDDPQSQGSST